MRPEELVSLFGEVNLGGTAIGTGINTKRGYAAIAVEVLSRLTGLPFAAANNLACRDTGSFVLFSGMLKRTETKLSKISMPQGGMAKLGLPACSRALHQIKSP